MPRPHLRISLGPIQTTPTSNPSTRPTNPPFLLSPIILSPPNLSIPPSPMIPRTPPWTPSIAKASPLLMPISPSRITIMSCPTNSPNGGLVHSPFFSSHSSNHYRSNLFTSTTRVFTTKMALQAAAIPIYLYPTSTSMLMADSVSTLTRVARATPTLTTRNYHGRRILGRVRILHCTNHAL
jgi:hypothetical protein